MPKVRGRLRQISMFSMAKDCQCRLGLDRIQQARTEQNPSQDLIGDSALSQPLAKLSQQNGGFEHQKQCHRNGHCLFCVAHSGNQRFMSCIYVYDL
jgi:hypothetical protein